MYESGSKVVVRGLSAAASYNGTIGVVADASAGAEGRLAVKLPNGKKISIKEENLEPYEQPAIIPAAQWEAEGMSKSDADCMERLQCLLLGKETSRKAYTVGLFDEYGYGQMHQELDYDHETLLPHWRDFAGRWGGEDTFSAGYVRLPVAVWDIITPKLTNLKSLTLEWNHMSTEEYHCLAEFIAGNAALEELSFQGNHINDLGAAKALSRAIKDHPSLKKLCGCYWDIGGCYDCEHGDTPTPKTEIGTAILAGCDNLEEMHLTRVGMDDSCADAYASLLKRNRKLDPLVIFWDYFSEAGDDAITVGVFDTTSLNAVVDSNHKCSVYVHETNDDPNRDLATKMMYVNGSNEPEKLKIRYKVQRALYGVGSEPFCDWERSPPVDETGKALNLAYFKDVPLELVPRVLSLLLQKRIVMGHEYADEGYYVKRSWFVHYRETRAEYLSRLWQALRGWVVPLLME